MNTYPCPGDLGDYLSIRVLHITAQSLQRLYLIGLELISLLYLLLVRGDVSKQLPGRYSPFGI